MSCSIIKDESGKIVRVLAPNERDSVLFFNLNKLPSTENSNHALQIWAQVYTSTFKSWYGDWENSTSEFQDENGEPLVMYTNDSSIFSPESYSNNGIVLSTNLPLDPSNSHATFLKPGKIISYDSEEALLNNLEKGSDPTEATNQYVKNMNNQGVIVKIADKFYAFDPSQVFEGLNNRQQITFTREQDYDISKVFISRDYDNLDSSEFVTQLVNNLAKSTGIDFEFVTEDEASLITKDTKNPYQGQAAFYFNNKIYFIGNKLSMKTALHEYSHPIVRALNSDNPDLFGKLYNEVISTTEGETLLREAIEEYPDYLPNDNIIKEEVIVKSITLTATNSINSKSFNNSVISKILFHIKQLLRKIFGKKINISTLNPSTTIEDLAKILEGEKIKLPHQDASESDVVSYVRDIKQLKKELQDVGNNEIVALNNTMYSLITRQIQQLRDNENYSALRNILSDESGRGDLAEMKANLKKYETVDQVISAANDMISDAQDMQKRSSALIRNIFTLDAMVKKIQSHMKDLKQESDQKGALNQMYYYSDLLRTWDIWMNDMIKSMDSAGIDQDTEIYRTVNAIQKRISSSKGLMETVYSEATSEILSDVWKPMNQFIRDRYDKETSNWKKELSKPSLTSSRKKFLEGELKKAEGNLEKSLVNKDKMKKILSGELGDAHWLNSYLESYLSNNDPAVGSFAVWLKNQMTDVQTTAHQNFNEFARDLEPVLNKLGFSSLNKNYQSIAKELVFVDSISDRDQETGELKEFKAYTFLNEFKNYKYPIAKMNDDIRNAKEAWLNEGTEEAYNSWKDKENTKEKHMSNFFHQAFTDEFNNSDKDLYNTEIGSIAKKERDDILEEIREFQQLSEDPFDEYLNADTVSALWRKYRQLFSTYDEYGKKKVGSDLEKSELLRANRDNNRKFYEWKESTGAFQNALKNFEITLVEKGIPEESDDFKEKRKNWIEANTKASVKEEFYTKRNNILANINKILDTLPQTNEKSRLFSEVWSEIIDATAGRRDDNGQPIATEMTKEHIRVIKSLQEDLEDAKKGFAGISGLTEAEMSELSDLYQTMDSRNLTQEESERYKELLSKKGSMGLSKFDKQQLFTLFDELENLQERKATDYYLDIVNEWHSKLVLPELTGTSLYTASKGIDNTNVDRFLDPYFVDKYFGKSEEFKQWFEDNHIKTYKWDPKTGEKELKYQRVYIWNIVRPKGDKYINKTNIYDEEGKVSEVINGIPSIKYFYRAVKDEYKTQKIVGETIDVNGNWLPKGEDQLDKSLGDWDRYINREYQRLKDQDPNKFELLNVLTKHHLKAQEGLNNNQKLGYEIPRYRKDLYEYTTSSAKNDVKKGFDKLWEVTKGTRDYFVRAKDDYEEGFNYEDQWNMINVDMYSGDNSKIPLTGRYKLDLDQVSLDITSGIMQHMLSAEKQKKLGENQPIARAIQHLVNKQNPSDMKSMNKQDKLYRKVTNFIPGKKNVRGKAINAFVEMHWEGKNLTGFGSENNTVQKSINLLLKNASFGMFAFDMTSALKNHFGATFQISLEAAGGRFLNYADYHRGRPWALQAMGEISTQLYQTGPKGLKVQMIEIFDPSQGRFEEKFGESLSRSLSRDMLNFNWMTSHRKWLETEATLQLFSGMMHSTKLEQVQLDGSVKDIRYIDAWEVVDGQVQLKKGIDNSWGIGGENFKTFKNKIHGVSNLLQGAYSSMDQGQANRYVLFRMVTFMKKFFVKMFVHRFGMAGGSNPLKGKERFDPALMESHMGFYIRNIQTIMKLLQSKGASAMYMTSDESRALKLQALEFVKLWIISLLMSIMFGWDPDDPDRLKKLKAKSGALPTFITNDDWEKNYNTWGWAQNHALLLLMHIQAENEHFIPLPGYGMNDMVSFFTGTSIATGPTVERYKDILHQVWYIVSGDKRAEYQKDVGALEWQQQGSKKIWSEFAKMAAIKGKSIDPVTSIKNFQSARYNSK